MFPEKVPVIPGMIVRHDPEGGLLYHVDKVVPSTDDYETGHALNGLGRVAYTQLEGGGYPAGTEWNKDQVQFRTFFTPLGLEGTEVDTNPDEYRVVQGSNEPIRIQFGSIHKRQRNDDSNDPMPGVRYRGVYAAEKGDLEIVSFLYHKTNPKTGKLEAEERLVIQEGLGFGVHPGHVGQPASWYIVGPQIGTVDRSTGEVHYDTGHNDLVIPKHFSIACIVDGPLGEPLLADPQQ